MELVLVRRPEAAEDWVERGTTRRTPRETTSRPLLPV